MKNKDIYPIFRSLQTMALTLALFVGLAAAQQTQAAAFQLPVTNAAGYGRAFAGGSLWRNDPSAAYNNPAAMAWFTGPIAQGSWIGIDVHAQFDGINTGSDIEPPGLPPCLGAPCPAASNPNARDGVISDGSAFYVQPISERFAIGFGMEAPYGLRTKYSGDWVGRDFGIMTSLKSMGLSLAASFKLSDSFALGVGVTGQRTRAQLNNGLNLGATEALQGGAYNTPGTIGQINVRVHDWSLGYFLGGEWKPTEIDLLGISYHSRVGNQLKGRYDMYFPNDGKSVTTYSQGPSFPSSTTINGKGAVLAIPQLNATFGSGGPLHELFPNYVNLPPLNPDGGPATASLDLPAFVTIDYLHQFSKRFSLGTSAQWTNWSKFRKLTLVSDGIQMLSLPMSCRNAWTLSLGGDYRLNEQWTLRGGLAWDQTPTTTATRDPRVPDNNRRILSIGMGYQPTARLTLDAAYSHQFLSDSAIHNTAPIALGGDRLDGSFDNSGNVIALTATYAL
ncbi:outer membrane protein transport protein [Dyella flagellata]|uniref:outer membrane protein transport protein n=1 Tax=Dyella flagellata TaxID=1867833 RepID=UPI0024E0DC48|nr:outer membrane protein transport protein [Dyella flagellata]